MASQPSAVMAVPAASANSPFKNRRGNVKFLSGRFNATKVQTRPKKTGGGGGLLSLRSTRRAAPRPSRVKGVFESLLCALNEGTEAVRNSVETLKSQLPTRDTAQSRVNYYLEQEKHIKALERKIRTLEVHRDRIEELRDDYTLKVKLKDGAFNLGEALANQSSKGAKEKLQEVRGEQKELGEDLCDIEDELETKLGVFTVHINGLVGLNHPSSGEQYEVHLQLASQKWKARCKISRQQQLWQDANIVFLGKIMDEMFVKIVEVRRIHGNTHMGSMKCQTRELLSFFPLNVTFNFSNASQAKLSLNVTWSPMLGEDFLSDLRLQTIHCLVSPQTTEPLSSRTSFYANVERLHMVPGSDGIFNDTGQKIQKLKIIREPEECGETPPTSQELPKAEKAQTKKKTSKDMENEFVFYDRDVLASAGTHLPPPPQPQKAPEPPPTTRKGSNSGGDNVGGVAQKVSSSSLYSTGTQESSSSAGGPTRGGSPAPELVSLGATVENLLGTLEEAKQTFAQLKELAAQLARLDEALKGGRLTKAPSMTLSENMVMESFDFLDNDDPRGKASSAPYSESLLSSVSEQQEDEIPGNLPSCGAHSQASVDSGTEEAFVEMHVAGKDSVGVKCVDRAILQHLVYCDHLLQNLHSSGPLKLKMTLSLKKLQQESGVIAELLNLAADPSGLQRIEQMLPELAAHDQLLKFWKLVARDNLLCVSCEQFAIALDNKFGETIWSEFPDIANKVFSEFLARIIDLDGDNSEQLDTMVVTVFQYSAYFTEHGSSSILKVMRDIAQELKVTEGLLLSDGQARGKIASLLEGYAYNRGALLASLYLLVDSNQRLQLAGATYVQKFCGHSPWHSKVVQYFIEQLEHTDQIVRCGACIALGKLEAKPAIAQLRHLSNNDFMNVREAARKALAALGEPITAASAPAVEGAKSDGKDHISFSPVRLDGPAHGHRHTALQRTRSAETS